MWPIETYNLSGGSLSAADLEIGALGAGTFTQTGGTNTANWMILGNSEFGSNGTYNLSAGSLSSQRQYIGWDGSGSFIQTGGTNTVSNILALAANGGAHGTYNLQGGSLTATTVNINAGGTFNQTGGGLTATAGLTNLGTYTMAGGTLTGGGLITNNATFSGYGTINANAGLSNYGTMTLTGGSSTINLAPGTSFYNQTTGSCFIESPTTINGNIYNYGYFKIYSNLLLQNGTFNGTFNSDPATTTAMTLTIGTDGAFQGGVGDKWVLSGDFINRSTQNITWNTVGAELAFSGSGNHQLYLPGADLGRSRTGYLNNFAWGSLDLTGQTLTLLDGNSAPGGALYVGTLLGVLLSGGQVTDIYGNGLDIYYDPSLADNAYLNDLTYQLAGGGYLMPVTSDFLGAASFSTQRVDTASTPVPGTIWLLLSGLVGLGLWRKKSGRGPGRN